MIILHVTTPAPSGGLETVVHGLAAGHLDRGHEVHVAAALHAPERRHPFLQSLRQSQVPVHEIQVPARAYLREAREIADLCRQVRPDVLHTHGMRTDVVTSAAAGPLGLPLVSTVHGYIPGGLKGRITERIQRQALRRFRAVVAVSRPLLRRLDQEGIRRNRLHLIPNAWTPTSAPLPRADARKTLGIPPDEFVLGWVGRLGHEKGPDIFVDAVARAGNLPVSASIIGEGSMGPQLERQARDLGVDGRIRWHGTVPLAVRVFPAFDALVLSSRTEGTPMVLLEAMALGVPVVAAEVGGVPDVVSADEAILVPPDDSEALARALQRIHGEDAQEREERVQRARARLEREFSATRWLERYETVYSSARSYIEPRGIEWNPSPSP